MRRQYLRTFRNGVVLASLVFTITAHGETIRQPAVAGLFYPRDPQVLSATIDRLLAQAHTERSGQLKALICPHAGYEFSGPVAASGFNLLRGLHVQTVVVLGPAHYAMLNEASVTDADVFRTPLGDVPVSPLSRELARRAPFALDPTCYVEAPDWVSAAERRGPGAMRAGTWEHADEVEVPFLQKTLGQFQIVPVVMGNVDAAAAARALDPLLNDTTLIVVSSDLSHYHPYADAQRLDRRTVNAVLALDPRKMATQEACGRIPILTLLHVAKAHGWVPKLLDLRNSGDTSGDKSRVVGYAAIAFYAPANETAATADTLTADDRQRLLKLARQAVRDAAARHEPQAVNQATLSPQLATPKGVFVTLTEHGDLRGCIGHIFPQMSLYAAVAENARSAALHDPRFQPVRPREVDQIAIEISVLTDPKPLAFDSPDDLLRKLRPNVDGVVLQIAVGGATYLPQVWEQLPHKIEFLDSLAVKAGGRPGDWRKPGTKVATYQVVSFKEGEP